ncbi:MAG: rhodanese-like domain-containing protein [Lutibacter sp.]|jgi:rhodanese-related sulfurtransferase|nr:rhodanese-like domain-containing protein [Lutibacter sp.]
MIRPLSFRIVFLASLILFACTGKQTTDKAEVAVLAPAVFKVKSVGHTLVDIRSPEEFASGHLQGAVNINYFDENFLTQLATFNKEQPLFIYCRSGNRTAKASPAIRASGFQKLYDLAGGIKQWKASGYPLVP